MSASFWLQSKRISLVPNENDYNVPPINSRVTKFSQRPWSLFESEENEHVRSRSTYRSMRVLAVSHCGIVQVKYIRLITCRQFIVARLLRLHIVYGVMVAWLWQLLQLTIASNLLPDYDDFKSSLTNFQSFQQATLTVVLVLSSLFHCYWRNSVRDFPAP